MPHGGSLAVVTRRWKAGGGWIWDLGFGIWDFGFRIWDFGFGISDLGFRIWDFGFGKEEAGSQSGDTLKAVIARRPQADAAISMFWLTRPDCFAALSGASQGLYLRLVSRVLGLSSSRLASYPPPNSNMRFCPHACAQARRRWAVGLARQRSAWATACWETPRREARSLCVIPARSLASRRR